MIAKKQLWQVRHDTTFQVAVEADLKNDIVVLQKECEVLDKSRIYLLGEQERLSKIVKSEKNKLTSLTNEIKKLSPESKRLQSEVDKAMERLNKLGKQDRVFREQLASEKLRVQQQERGVKNQRAELKQEINELKQVHPKLASPKIDKSTGYMKI